MQAEICKCCGKPKKKITGKRDTFVGNGGTGNNFLTENSRERLIDITSPATPAAAEWDGWGTALKPAWEPIIVARKPLQGTVAENVQRYGTGAMNIDGCRIETDNDLTRECKGWATAENDGYRMPWMDKAEKQIFGSTQGRWPANLIHDGSAEVLAGFPQAKSCGTYTNSMARDEVGNDGQVFGGTTFSSPRVVKNKYAGDTGSAARFFYCAKASKQDRDEGCEDIGESSALDFIGSGIDGRGNAYETQPRRNHHPTVKPTSLMRYLCRLVTPPNGVILDPFMGSGSTGKAAMLEGFNFIGIDTEIEYVEIAARRIEHACEKVGIVVEQPMMFETRRETVDKPKQLILL